VNKFPVGSTVRATQPNDYQSHIAAKLRNRVGVVERHQYFSERPIVRFPAIGRRKEFLWVAPRASDLEIVEAT